jgi:hypothetical protein
MTCQILNVNLPTCRTAIRRKTAARTTIAIYVKKRFYMNGDEAWHPRLKKNPGNAKGYAFFTVQ